MDCKANLEIAEKVKENLTREGWPVCGTAVPSGKRYSSMVALWEKRLRPPQVLYIWYPSISALLAFVEVVLGFPVLWGDDLLYQACVPACLLSELELVGWSCCIDSADNNRMSH